MGAVLVTGGAGYIGSHAVKALREAGREVVVIDNLLAGHRQAVDGAPLVTADVADAEAVRGAVRRYGVTSAIHFAALASVSGSVRDPARYYAANVVGTLALVDALVGASVEHLVFSSTAAVYGKPVETPITEDHPARPINPYGETKLAIERALPHYEQAYGLRSMSLRYFNAAGADPGGRLGEHHEPEEHLIPLALAAASGGPPLVVFGGDYPTGDGTCRRDYVHVSDLAAAHLLALSALEAGGASGVCNVGNERAYSVREVVAAVEQVTGMRVPHEMGARRPGDPAVLLASIARARSMLGWEPVYDEIETIVETAWRWQRSHPRGYAS